MILGQQQPAYLPKADALTGAGAAMVDDDALEVIRQPERTVWAAGWHLQEQSVLERPAGTAARAGRPAAAVERVAELNSPSPPLRLTGSPGGLRACLRDASCRLPRRLVGGRVVRGGARAVTGSRVDARQCRRFGAYAMTADR